MRLTLEPITDSGKDVLSVSGAAMSFNGHSLFSGLSFEIKKGEHASVGQSCAIFSNTALWPEGKMESCGVGRMRCGHGFKRLQLSRRRAEEAAKKPKKRACRDAPR